MNGRLGLAVAALLLAVACPVRAEPLRLSVDGVEREYLLHVPGALPVGQAVPLVFVFHGGGGTAAGTMALSRFNAVADREQFLVVYPQGIGRGWNDGRITQVSQAHRENVNDLAFVDALLAHLSRQYRIDPRRVFATGISNGGIFSHYLAAHRAEKIAAIAPVAGGIAQPFDQVFRPAAPVSVLIVQGTADPLVPYAGGRIAGGDGKDRGSIIATDAAVNLWVRANATRAQPETSTLPDRDPGDGCRTQVFAWNGGAAGSAVWLYRVEGGGHTWPGGTQYLPRRFIGRVTNDFDSAAIWEFFKQHPKP
jgi:polyhydroxybutyrate depolymerase